MGPRLGEREVLLSEVQGLAVPAAQPQRILYVAHDHLNLTRGVLKDANPATDVVILVESARMTTGRPWHKERLFFLLSSARHFAVELEHAGFTVRYLKAPTTIDGLQAAKDEFGELPVFSAEPSSPVSYTHLTLPTTSRV